MRRRNNTPQFFDSWGEGPFSLEDVRRWAQETPAAKRQFHVCERPRITLEAFLALPSPSTAQE